MQVKIGIVVNCLVLGLFTISFSVCTLGQDLNWVRGMEEEQGSGSYVSGRVVTHDANDNVFATGYFYGVIDLDPSSPAGNLAAGTIDCFFVKYSAAGDLLWAKSIAGFGSSYGTSIAADGLGNCYISGYFNGNADFDPSPAVYTVTIPNNNWNGFVAKYDLSGNLVWVHHLTGSSTMVSDVGVDAASNVYITGGFSETVDFDFFTGVSNLTAVQSDAFVAKYTPAGDYIWAIGLGGNGSYDHGISLTTDAQQNAYVTGSFEQTADFDPSGNTFNLTSAGSMDMFVAKYDLDGAFQWAASMGSAEMDVSLNVDLDAIGHIYLGGNYSGTADFDPSAGEFLLTSAGERDSFIAKYDASGELIWVRPITGSEEENLIAITVSAPGDVYFTGGYSSHDTDIDPSSGTLILPQFPWGGMDMFLGKLDASGNLVWANGISGAFDQWGLGIDLNESGAFYVTGEIMDTVDLDLSEDVVLLPGGNDFLNPTFFLASYDASCINISEIIIKPANCIAPASGTASISITDPSVITSYDWNPGTPDGDGTAAVSGLTAGEWSCTITDTSGCEGIVTFSIEQAQPTITELTENACDSYTLNGLTYEMSGDYQQVLTGSYGCDSTVVLHLTVSPTPSGTITADNAISLTASGNAESYQWIDCNTMLPVIGAVGNTFVASENGSYAVTISNGDCSTTSECFPIVEAGIKEQGQGDLQIVPNPSSGLFILCFGSKEAMVEVYTVRGELVLTQKMVSGDVLNIERERTGTYLVRVTTIEGTAVERLVKY